MGDRYGMSDLRQFMAGRTHFSAVNNLENHFTGTRNLTTGPHRHYESMVVGGNVGEVLFPAPPQRVEFRSDSGFEEGCCVNGRWPRQETLTLLEIRSRLDSKFKEANQKGPLWDEVSRIMAEENGFQRSGKKCREKFENLYKYYKKTREGKAGRQDGKHYRFFRQLEALYGENTEVSQTKVLGGNPYFQITNSVTDPPNQQLLEDAKLCDTLSLSNSSEFDTSSSSDDDDADDLSVDNNTMKKNRCLKKRRKSWKTKIQEIVDLQMKKYMEIQEAWLEKMLATLERKEQERMCREEEWRKKEWERFDREHMLWANERAWIEAREVALMEALSKITGGKLKAVSPEEQTTTDLLENHTENESEPLDSTINKKRWPESEISSLIRLRSAMELQFGEEGGCAKVSLWEEISAKMRQLGYDRSAKRCKEKWENINKYYRKAKECNKKRKENSRTCPYFQHLDSLYNGRDIHGHQNDDQVRETMGIRSDDDGGPSPSNSNARAEVAPDSCSSFLIGEGVEELWKKYALKINRVHLLK